MLSSLVAKFETRKCRVVVIGAGYVGLSLIVELTRAGFRTTGLDKDPSRVRSLNAGDSYIGDVASSDLAPHVSSGLLDATVGSDVLNEADVVIVCVPTPLNKTKEPDLRFVIEAMDEVARYQHDGMLVILESTTYPGSTSEIVIPKLVAQGAVVGRSVFVAFSPERVDPGNQVFKTRNTPKVIGGATPECLHVACALYSRVLEEVVPVSSTETAEMVKLLENTFRAVNIGLVNEIAMMSRKLGVDSFEVIRAASTKPFGFMPFYPGPGLGGHCIPIDPLYLSWKMRTLHYHARFIELADTVNGSMPAYVVERTSEALNDHAKPLRGSKILIYGVAYKRDVADVRESPALTIILALEKRGARVAYMDPLISELDEDGMRLTSVERGQDFGEFDAVIIIADHSFMERDRMMLQAKLIIDTRDALRGVDGDRSKVYGL